MEHTEVVGPPRGGGLFAMRGVLVGLGALLSVLLLARGWVLIGGVLLVMAVLRTVMLVNLHRHRAWRMQRRQEIIARRRQRPERLGRRSSPE